MVFVMLSNLHGDVIGDTAGHGFSVIVGNQASELRLACHGVCMENSLAPLLVRAAHIYGCSRLSVVLRKNGMLYTAAAVGMGEEYVGESNDGEGRVSDYAMKIAASTKRPVLYDMRKGEFMRNPDTGYETSKPFYLGMPLFSECAGKEYDVIGILNVTGFDGDPRDMATRMAIVAEYASKIVSEASGSLSDARRILSIIGQKDGYTMCHCKRVAQYADLVAAVLSMPKRQRLSMNTYASVHDVGKLYVPDHVLNKPGKLDEKEFEVMKSHANRGAEAMRDDSDDASVVGEHHEHWDGRGYNGKAGWGIDPRARVVAVADAYDAMTSERPYRHAMSAADALAEIGRGAGSQFEPCVADAFLRVAAGKRDMIAEIMAME